MSKIRQRLSEALTQAALEGDDSPKVMVSMRVLEILSSDAPRMIEVAPMAVRGDELRAALAINGRSQTELARRLGVHVSAINKICSGVRDVSAREAEQITAYLAETHGAQGAGVGSAGARLRSARRAAGLAVSEVAKRMEMSPSAIRNQENGTNGVPSSLAPTYAEAYGVTPEWIMFGSPLFQDPTQ